MKQIKSGFITVDVRAGNVLVMPDKRIHDTVEKALEKGGMVIQIQYETNVKGDKKEKK